MMEVAVPAAPPTDALPGDPTAGRGRGDGAMASGASSEGEVTGDSRHKCVTRPPSLTRPFMGSRSAFMAVWGMNQGRGGNLR